MQNLTTLLASASVLGTKAYLDGKKCIPLMDKDFMSLLEGLDSKDSIKLMKEWLKNWNYMNLKNKVTPSHSTHLEKCTHEDCLRDGVREDCWSYKKQITYNR